MSQPKLRPRDLAVESFATAAAPAAASTTTDPVPVTMQTFERDCTYPDLCGGTY